MFGVGEPEAPGRVAARGRPRIISQAARRAGRGGLSLALFLHHGAALIRALLLALHFHPALALALVLAGAGMAAVGGSALALALARVDARALHGLARVLLPLGRELVTAREHADDRCRNDEAQSLLADHPSVLLAAAWTPVGPPWPHGRCRSIHNDRDPDKPGAAPPPRLTNGRAPVNNSGFCHPGPPAGSSRLTGETLSPGNRLAIAFALLVPSLALLAGCQRPPAVAFTVAPARAEGQPDRLAVTMRIQGAPSKGLELRGFATTGVLKIEDISAAGADGAPIAAATTIENASFNNRTLDIPRIVLRGPLPPTLVVRYTVRTGTREGDSHMGFTGRCHGYFGKEFGFTVGRALFLLPEPPEALQDLSVSFDLPQGWEALAPWAKAGDAFRPGVGGTLAAEHLVSAAGGFGRFHERSFDLGGTRCRLAFEADIPAEQEERAAKGLEAAARYVHGLFGRDLGPEYLVVVAPKAPTGDEIAGEGWGTGQGGTLAPLTADRLHTFAMSLIEAYVRHAPYRTEVARPEEYWLVDGVKQLYSWRAVAAAGLIPEEEVTRSLAVGYLLSIGVLGIEPDLEKIYSSAGAHRIETEARAPFVLAHLDHELRGGSGGKETLDALLPAVFGRSRAPSFWSIVPQVHPDFRAEFRTRYVQGREIIPLGRAYTLAPTQPQPDPPAGPVTRRLTLLFTGDTQGYLENCGCKVNQSGGVARRSTALPASSRRASGSFFLSAARAVERR